MTLGFTCSQVEYFAQLVAHHQETCERDDCPLSVVRPEPLPARRPECGKRHLIHSSGRVLVCNLPEGHPGPCEGPRRTEAA